MAKDLRHLTFHQHTASRLNRNLVTREQIMKVKKMK